MTETFRSLIGAIDWTVHAELRKREGMPLLRARVLSLASGLIVLTCSVVLLILTFSQEFSFRMYAMLAMILQSLLILALNRVVRQVTVLAGCSLLLTSLFLAVSVIMQSRSLIAPGILWFPVLMMPNFLLCGRRIGFIVSALMAVIATFTLLYCRSYGPVLPFGNDPVTGIRTLIVTVLLTNGITVAIVTLYTLLMNDNEKSSQDQRAGLQRTARMHELLQMSGHFALQTNRHLDVLGTALHNMEDPLQKRVQPLSLVPMLEPVDSSIRHLAAVARSFSLFSRRYLEEGLEQTSVNAILQHVDTIYNVGEAQRRARLHWVRLESDIAVNTQTAKLVMLIISLIRSLVANGGLRITASTLQEDRQLWFLLHYRLPSSPGRNPKRWKAHSDDGFDPELTEHLIAELCTELGIHRLQTRDGEENAWRLKLPAN